MDRREAKDYEVTLAGHFIGIGGAAFLMDALGIDDADSCAKLGLAVRRLPDLWYLPFEDKVMTTAEAARELELEPGQVEASKRTTRYRRHEWVQDAETVDSIRRAAAQHMAQGQLIA